MSDFRHEVRKFLAFSKQHLLADARTTPEQYEALLAIRICEQPPCIGDLAERLQVKHHTAISTVNALAKRKLIKRVRSTRDRRKVHLHLTPAGRELVETLAARHRPEIRTRVAQITRPLEILSR